MKITKSKLVEIIRMKNEGKSSYQARKIAGISVRRVNQVYLYYLQNGKPPAIGRRMGRPIRPITDEEKEIVQKVYSFYRVPASVLEAVIEKDYKLHIPHNHIHKIMIKLGLAKPKKVKDIRKKKLKRYERRHSLTAVHLDWFYYRKMHHWALPVIDDASRKLLALVEDKQATTDLSIKAMETALQHGKIRQCISDHGTQFIKDKNKSSRFHDFLTERRIRHILCRIRYPQSNGKSEKFNSLYKRHRHTFKTKEEFIVWYNEIRPHSSLQVLETPAQAFIRKMKPEA
jgi:transposase InsO family protein